MKTFDQFAQELAEGGPVEVPFASGGDKPSPRKKSKERKTAPDGGKMSMVIPMSATVDNVSTTMVGDQINQA
jgi:hypothetical protein